MRENDFKFSTSSLYWNRATDYNKKLTWRVRRKDSERKEYKESNLKYRPRGKTTTGSALDETSSGWKVFDIAQILAYLIHNMSRSQFGHLAIAVSPRLEVEIGGHASLDGCNFQRKRPGPHGIPPVPPCVHRLPCGYFWSSIWLFKSQRCYDNRHLFFSQERHKKNYHRYQNGMKNKKVSEFWMSILYQCRSWLNDYQLGLRTMVIFCSDYDVYIIFSHYHCYWWFGDAMRWDPFFPWPFLLAWINFNPSMDK